MRNYRDLKVWERAHHLTLNMYKLTSGFPKVEMYALTSQIRRAAASIGANLAEGCGRRTEGEFGRFILIAMGSASELDYHLLLAHDLRLIPNSDYDRHQSDLTEIRRMLTSLFLKLKANS